VNKVKADLETGPGYVVAERLIPEPLIDAIVSKLDTLHPVRASSSGKKYAERDEIKNLPDIAVWWSQTVMDWPEVVEISSMIKELVTPYLASAELYSSDIVVIEPNSQWVNPHIDTPHRFKHYNYDKRLLGIQSIIALSDLDKTTAATGLVPGSQIKDFNINLCYQGFYNQWFIQHCIQPKLPKGSVLFYNCRLMHSSMPNKTNKQRPALLLNYLDNSIIDDIKSIDNVWKSNQS
jgi:ectoine hydroxylase-related dioxygenase (phytanoyl-CoA dioxygenase family)